MPNDNSLIHFGVKGMRWGVRKGPERPAGVSRFKSRREARKARQMVRAEDTARKLNIENEVYREGDIKKLTARLAKGKITPEKHRQELEAINEFYDEMILNGEYVYKARRDAGIAATALAIAATVYYLAKSPAG